MNSIRHVQKIANNCDIANMTTDEVQSHIFEDCTDQTLVELSESLALNIINKGQHLSQHLKDWAWASIN